LEDGMNDASIQHWTDLLQRAHIALEPPRNLQHAPVASSPWAIRLLAGIGGFIGGMMILLMVGSFFAALRIFNDAAVLVFAGLALALVAVAFYRVANGSAAGEQCGLAMSIAAQAAFAVGLSDVFKTDVRAAWWILVVLQGVLLWLIANGLHRTLTAAAMVVFGALAARQPGLLMVWWTVAALAACVLMQLEAHILARGSVVDVAPAAFGLLCGLLITQWPWMVSEWGPRLARGASPLLWAMSLPALLAAAWAASATAGGAQRIGVLLLALGTGVLGLWLPGWTTALLLAVLGLAHARPGWAVVAVLAMIFSVWRFYYAMQVTLLEKALWMAVAGAVCLLLAAAVRLVWPVLETDMEAS